ncbi:MAG: hypothetical protein IPI49_17125 [Myxococcales bacterium]|jgi:hypothetical protein|nr:hypothetical protein [Myxococcales bacterium]HRC57807.1 hypothetical protein [Kofleriaceae bacterium]
MSPRRASALAHTIALTCGALLATACSKKDGAASGADKTEQTDKLVNCAGINECKGKSLCHTEKHKCAGQNSCKGEGWLDVTAADCTAKGGKIIQVTRK